MSYWRYEVPKKPGFGDLSIWQHFKPGAEGPNGGTLALANFLADAQAQGADLTTEPQLYGAILFHKALCAKEGRVLLDDRPPYVLAKYSTAQYLIALQVGQVEQLQDVAQVFDTYQRWVSPGPRMLDAGHYNPMYQEADAVALRQKASDEGRCLVPFEWFRVNRPDKNPEALALVQAYATWHRQEGLDTRIPGCPAYTSWEDFLAKRPDLAKAKEQAVQAECKAADAARETFAAWVVRTGSVDFSAYEASLKGEQKVETAGDL